jgi:ribonuclease J
MVPPLQFIPLGGTGEIGMNLNVYQAAGKLLVVDAGVMFERLQGGATEVWMPDISWLAARRDDVVGLVITHAHQDHIGAVCDLWPQLRCPVYATPFAARMLEGPARDAGLLGRIPVRVIPEVTTLRLGPFALQRLPLTHSTVEMGALVVRAGGCTVLHTGDFKLDPAPLVGLPWARRALAQVARHGVDGVVSDSTNADHEGWTPSESEVHEPLLEAVQAATGRVAVTLFSSNVARLHTIARIARATGRDLVFLGRSLLRTVACAKASGYLTDLPAVVPARDVGYVPADRVLLVCTGSQGELRAGLSRVAAGQHPHVYLEAGDTVIFSARAIPGNELALARLDLLLAERHVHIVRPTADGPPIHVSGHPRRDELRALYELVQPRWVLPVHGTPPKLEAHAQLAESMGIGAVRAANGDRWALGPVPQRVGRVRTGRVRRTETPIRRRGGHRRH